MINISAKIIEELVRKYQLTLLVLFGSHARGKTHHQSDVDFGFLAKIAVGPADIAAMQTEFIQRLQIKNIEMTDLKQAPPLLLRRLAERSILLHEDEPSLFARFKIYALKRSMEAKPLLNLRQAALNRFLKKI